MLKKLVLLLLCVFILLVASGVVGAIYGYQYFTRDLPDFTSIDDYRPPAVTQVYSDDKTLVGEFFKERRYPVQLQKVPLHVRNAFLAAEDASFYSHPGIDFLSILRALIKNLQTGSVKQGASTITQQVIKNILLSREKKYERKIKEAILAYRLEQRLTKDQILELYLNQIYFGNGAYGIKAAAQIYFKKDVSELSLGQASMLAGLPKAPSRYSPIRNFDAAKKRQRYVLKQMVKAGFVDSKAAQAAVGETFNVYSHDLKTIYQAPFYVSEVRRRFIERWKEYDLDLDGLQIHTALNLTSYRLAQAAVKQNLRSVDKRRGWRGPKEVLEEVDSVVYREKYPIASEELLTNTVYPALVVRRSLSKGVVTIQVGEKEFSLDVKKAKWAQRLLTKGDNIRWVRPVDMLKPGAVTEVVFENKKSTENKSPKQLVKLPEPLKEGASLKLDQTPELESALVLIDPHTGKVPAVIGGYNYKHSQFNRATQGIRQPGSAFKPVVYLTALDSFGFTPTTIVYDEPRAFKVGDEYWTPANYDKDFLGPITLRTALQKSRNLISADIISRIGVDPVIQFARKTGIESKLGRNLSLSLGSSEVTPLELTRAYGVFAAKGILFDSIFITKIYDRYGNKLYDFEDEKLIRAREVIKESSAFVMTYMMKGVVQYGTGWRIKELKRPVAGKTGTSNDQMDAWFVGYTPEWACGVWTGFDIKKTIGEKETGGKVSAPAWLNFMNDFLLIQDQKKLADLEQNQKADAERLGIPYTPPTEIEPLDFSVPDDVEPFWIDRHTGTKTLASDENAFLEYFEKGTEPEQFQEEVEDFDYWNNPAL